MTDYLVRRFVPDHENTASPAVRQRYGTFSGIVGIVCNLLLFAFKFLAGTLTGSIAITADAFNNLSDAGSSVVTLLGFKLAGQAPDPDHPFGHGRMEYLSGLVVAAIILMMGFELLKSSIDKILHPASIQFSAVSILILAVSILGKLWMSRFNRVLGDRISSATLLATAADSRGDALSTGVVLIGTLVGSFTPLRIDGWLGLLVAAVILKAGWEAGRDTLDPLLGGPPDPELVQDITDTVLEHEVVCGVHDLIVHDYGPGRCMITLHAEVRSDGNLLEIHDAIDHIEQELQDKYGCHATIHMDPLDVDNEDVASARLKVIMAIKTVDERITIHDFRIVVGPTHTNCIFDAAVPYDCKLSDKEAADKIRLAVHDADRSYAAVVTVDRSYC